MAKNDTLLELVDVTKRYAAVSDHTASDVLRGVSLSVKARETIAIMGPSGSGKSTLLNIIGTLDKPTEGRVLLNGVDLTALDERETAIVRNRKIGFVFQMHHLLPQCSAIENVLVPTLVCRGRARCRDTETRARHLLDRVGLGQRLHHRPAQLSGGEQQRVAVVRALINEPQLVLADEPTGSLDQASADELARLLVELNEAEGVTLIVVTHTPSVAACMRHCFHMYGGVLVPAGDTL